MRNSILQFGIDTCLSRVESKRVVKDLYDSSPTEFKPNWFAMSEYMKSNYEEDWLISLLSDYGDKRSLNETDAMSYLLLQNLIHENRLWMALFPCEDFAQPDVKMKKNHSIIGNAIKGIEIKKGKNSDGLFTIKKEVSFNKLFANDCEPENIDNIKNDILQVDFLQGAIEVGDQPLSKSVVYLLDNSFLIRLPYTLPDGMPPVIALFCSLPPDYNKQA